ncbi:MAG: type II secretion system F family protein [Actinomycetota bacterium]|nr:type II secretion system F family protein [Actinomycetota bacterium]
MSWLVMAAGVVLLRGRPSRRAVGIRLPKRPLTVGDLSASDFSDGDTAAGDLSHGDVAAGSSDGEVTVGDLSDGDVAVGRGAASGAQQSSSKLLPLAAGTAIAAAFAVLGGRIGLIAAAPAAIAVILLVRRMLAAVPVAGPDRRSVAFVLDLIACALSAGAPPELALAGVSSQVARHGTESMRQAMAPLQLVGRLLTLGTEPTQAWSVLDATPTTAAVGAAGRRCAHSGARLAGALTETAADLREQHRAEAITRAERTGVWALLPLGCCFLPAFVCLGVLPVVVGVAGQVFASSS